MKVSGVALTSLEVLAVSHYLELVVTRMPPRRIIQEPPLISAATRGINKIMLEAATLIGERNKT